MTEPEMLRAFVNGSALSIEHGRTIIDAVRAFDPAEADAIVAGTRAVSDSRGLPVALETALTGGTVIRLVSARALRAPEDHA
jgi:hypothetical protein